MQRRGKFFNFQGKNRADERQKARRCARERIKMLWRRMAARKDPAGRIIVVRLSKKESGSVEELLPERNLPNVGKRHSKSEAAAGHLKMWREGARRVMAGASALGREIDCPSARLVAHIGGSCSRLDCAQETGRGGCDGSVFKIVVALGLAK